MRFIDNEKPARFDQPGKDALAELGVVEALRRDKEQVDVALLDVLEDRRPVLHVRRIHGAA